MQHLHRAGLPHVQLAPPRRAGRAHARPAAADQPDRVPVPEAGRAGAREPVYGRLERRRSATRDAPLGHRPPLAQPAVSRRRISACAYPSSARIFSLCSPSAGIGSRRGSKPDRLNGGFSMSSSPPGEPTFAQRPRAASCGWAQNCAMSLSRALAMSASSSRSITSAVLSLENTFSISACIAGPFSRRAGLEANRTSVFSEGFFNTTSQNRANSRSFCTLRNTVPPSPALNGPYGTMVAWYAPERGGALPP